MQKFSSRYIWIEDGPSEVSTENASLDLEGSTLNLSQNYFDNVYINK